MRFMSPLVNATETDDPTFISSVNCLTYGLVSRQGAPNELWIIPIDNWFDHKWLRFSGIGRVDFQFGPSRPSHQTGCWSNDHLFELATTSPKRR